MIFENEFIKKTYPTRMSSVRKTMTKTTLSQKFKKYDLYKIIKMNQIKFDVQKYCYPMVLKMNLESANLNLHVWTASS